MGESIQKNHGYIDKYMGDGIMAIFGLKGEEPPTHLALKAAQEMMQKCREFNQYLKETFHEEFRIGDWYSLWPCRSWKNWTSQKSSIHSHWIQRQYRGTY